MMKLLSPVLGICIGLCIGWLTGLSQSPVIAAVIASLLALTAPAAALIGSQDRSLHLMRSLTYSTLVAVGIAIGAPFGILARTTELFSASPKSIAARFAMDETTVAHDMYRLRLRALAAQQQHANPPGLFSVSTAACQALQGLPERDFETRLKASPLHSLQMLSDCGCKVACLQAAIEELCGSVPTQ